MLFIILSVLFLLGMIALNCYTSSERWFRNHCSFHWLFNLSTALLLFSPIMIGVSIAIYLAKL
jgi:hypothetical protein